MMARFSGRPRQISSVSIVQAGRKLGLKKLSLHAVAAELKVSPTALYRHVEGRWGLERLVGESLLADLRLQNNSEHDTVRHLLSFALQLRRHALDNPGLAAYLQTLFPRGASGRRLLADEVQFLMQRGYQPDAAMVLCSAVASMAIGHAAAEDARHQEGIDAAQQDAVAELDSDEELQQAYRGLPVVDNEEYVRLILIAMISGLVDVAPPGRDVREVIADLYARGSEI